MRRLVGLIALLVLILGAAWLARNDFDLNRIAELDTLFGPAGNSATTKMPPEEVAATPATEAAAPSGTAQSGTEAAAPSSTAAGTELVLGATEPSAVAAEPAAPQSKEMAAAEPAPPVSETAPAPETASVDPGVDTAMVKPADGGDTAAAKVPSFDIVRVEPTGETVIAGTAEPEATVEVLSGPEPVATAEANQRGEWALVLEKPLPPGTHDLAIRTTSKDRSQVTLSDQRVAVSVPESADEEPLVVLNQPNAPSQVIQVPAETETAAAQDGAVASGSPTEAESGTSPSATETEIAAAQQSGMADKPASATAEMAAVPAPESPGPMAPLAAGSEASAPTAKPSMPGEPESKSGLPAMASAAESAPAAAATPEPGTTAKEKVAAAPQPERMSPPSDRSESAASSSAVGNGAMAVAEPGPSASETATAASPESPESQTAMGETAGEASSAPGSSPPTETAAEPAVSHEQPAAAETASAAEEASPPTGAGPGSPAVVEAPPPAAPEVGVAAVEAETNGRLYIAGTATTPAPVRVYVDDEFLGETTPSKSGTWLLETAREMAPDEYTIRADQVDTANGKVIARAEVPFEREIAVATLKPTGESASAGTAEVSGSVAGPMKVIIKRGDNLWRISREMYGHGIRYSTIYQANRDQIRNPNLIYPGQVFVLPAGDTGWQN